MANYPVLTQEQKRRKQSIRNWRKMQKQLVEYYIFAKKCQRVYIKDVKNQVDKEMETAYSNLCYSFKCIFKDE